MSSGLEYYAKQSKFLPAKACSWVSRDQRLWENSDKHVPHPFSLGEQEWYALQLAAGELPSMLLPFSAPLQSGKAAAQTSLAALCWPRPHHHQETRRRRGVIPLACETPEHQPTPVGSGLPQHKLQPSPSCLPSCPALTARGALLTQKGEGIRHCTDRADLSKMV